MNRRGFLDGLSAIVCIPLLAKWRKKTDKVVRPRLTSVQRKALEEAIRLCYQGKIDSARELISIYGDPTAPRTQGVIVAKG